MKTKKAKAGDNKPIQARLFSGINDLSKWIETTPTDDGWTRNHARDALNFEFCGAYTFQGAKTDLLKGKNVTEIKNAIPRGTTTRATKKRGLDVIGGCPNVPAFLSGSPACMYRIKTEKTKGAYNVFIDVSAHCGITKRQIRDAGIEALIRVLRLSSKYPVNLYAGDTAIYDGRYAVNMTKIMDAGKPFNVARVSYALTEPAFLRVFSFCCIERTGGYWDKGAEWGYGRPVNDKYIRRDVADKIMRNAITISLTEIIKEGDRALREIDEIIDGRKGR